MAYVKQTSLVLLVLTALTGSLGEKPTSLKWAQYRDGTIVAAFPLKRGSRSLCVNERAFVEHGVLIYSSERSA